MENLDETKPEGTTPIQSQTEIETLVITEDIRSFIYETAKWTKFLSIIGFIGTGLMIVFAFSIGDIMSALSTMSPGNSMFAQLGTGVLTVLYLLIALVYFYPSLLLFKYANSAKRAVLFADQPSLSVAMSKLKSFFKFWGILTIVVISFYIIFILFIVVAGIGAANMAG